MACGVLVAAASLATAPSASAQEIPGFSVTRQFNIEINGSHYRLVGQVEMEQEDQQFFADEVDYWADTGRLVAVGNVLYASRDNRIAADRLDFNTKTRTGTFFNATGTASIADRVEDRSLFGTQEPDAYFFGEQIEKIGTRKYRITRGGFTTCVQPTPRWEITSRSATLTLEKYALVRNPVLKVKGVPVFYAPVLYYPINREDRATGFLLPVYGTSTLRGQSISNAFFWAINRSQDATLFHDWYARTGQGTGGEYRYVTAPGSEGSARAYFLDEHAATFTTSSGGTTETPERRSYEVRAQAVQALPGRLRARGAVDYFSDFTVVQTFNTNVYDASRRMRSYGGNVAGSWGSSSLSGTYDVRQVFFGDRDSTTVGGSPRVAYNLGSTRIGQAPIYYALGSEYAQLIRESRSGDRVIDQGLSRIDVSPSVRVPFTRWPFLTVNSSVAWRHTYYSESLDENRRQIAEPVYRRYFDMRSDIVGPVFNRIFDTPDNGYAEKFKHVIEPAFSVQRVTPIEETARIVRLESSDFVVGDVTKVSYGLTNRLLAKRREGGGLARTREFLSVTVFQSYYTDARASQFDPSFNSSFGGREPTNFSPVVVGIRASPTDRVDGTVRLEYDHQLAEFATIRADGRAALGRWLDASGGWSRRTLARRTDNFINAASTIRTPSGRVGGVYAFNYDIARETMLQQRVMGYYNAQCCGIVVEFQSYNFPTADPRFPIPTDRRFNISFTLAGVGTFSNFFGALGGSNSAQR